MAGIRPIEAAVWDRRTIALVRRELEKGFNSMMHAYEQAKEEQTEAAQAELNTKSNFFYDLYDKRLAEYEACSIEDEPNAENMAGQLMQDMVRYKVTLNTHIATKAAKDVDEIADDPAEDVGVVGRLSMHESRMSEKGVSEEGAKGKPEVTKETAPQKETPPASMLNSLRKKAINETNE